MGPSLGRGDLFNLDLVATDRIHVPSGVWGLGPDLPRRLPFILPLAWASTIIPGSALIKMLMGATIVVAAVGAHRLVPGLSPPARLGVGLLYGLSPFLLTRISIGHLGIYLAAAVLPWVVRPLLRPADSLAKTYLAALALALTGVAGGMLAALVLIAGLIVGRGRRWGAVVGVALVAQLPWLVPGALVAAQGIDPTSGEGFESRVWGFGQLVRLAVGQGFWQEPFQIGVGAKIEAVVVGLVVLTLAAYGWRRACRALGVAAGVAAGISLFIAAASDLPLLDSGYRAVADLPVGVALREGHRLLPVWLLVLAVAAGHGADRLAGALSPVSMFEPVAKVVPIAAALALAAPGFWGFGSTLQPYDLPPEWEEARGRVNDQPGAVVAFPWTQYLNFEVAGGRRVFNPVRSYFDGDVLSSSNPNVGDTSQERADPRETRMRELAEDVTLGRFVADDLADLGVRWIVLVRSSNWEIYEPSLAADPGLRRVVSGESLELFEVVDWPGRAVDPRGESVDVDQPLAPIAVPDTESGFTWFRPGAWGWSRGFQPASSDAEGLLTAPSGGGPMLYWPAGLALAAQMGPLVVAGWGVRRVRRTRNGVG